MYRLALAMTLAATAAGAQDLTYGDPRVSMNTLNLFDFNFRAGIGAQSAPDYFGASTSSTGATGSFEFGSLYIFGRCFGCDDTPGFGFTGSARYIGAREETDLTDIDAALELGGGLSYTSTDVEAFAVVRRGFGGHDGYVVELGGDYIIQASDQLTLKAGPRLLAGDDTFQQTYFGTPDFNAQSGLVSRGLELSATYDMTPTWGITATARYDQLRDDAAASPISESDDQTTLSLVLTRAFDW